MTLKKLFILITAVITFTQPLACAQDKAAVRTSPSLPSEAEEASSKTENVTLNETYKAPQEKETQSIAYKIGAGDTLAIHVWKEPELSRENVLVRIDGKISFPLLDDINVAGLTPAEVKTMLQDKLKDYIENPTITVIVTIQGSQQYYILGEVANTGAYPLYKDLTILQAFALAGGFAEWASKSEIILLRKENGTEKIITINYKDIIKGKDFSQNIILKANDTIIVP